jgi:D-xylose transport system substrate-binding protein
MKVLQPSIDRGDILVLADLWVPEWSATEAYIMVTKELSKLKAAPRAIVASNDAIAGGAIQALEDKGAECWSRVRTQISPPSSASSMAPN